MRHQDALAAASDTIRRGSKSFAIAARLFDRPTREAAILLYAWCRHCDDVVDGQTLGHQARPEKESAARLASLETETRSVLAGEPSSDPAFSGLRTVLDRHEIPERYPLQHLDGFRMDVEGRSYETFEDTLDYAYHVAGVVGVMMGHIMGVRDPAVLDRASDLGIAFQLTNITRDIVEDAAANRVYLPSKWLAEAGIFRDEIVRPEHRHRLAKLAARLVEAAEPYYASAEAGIAALPPRSAWAITTAHRVYRQIGVDIVAKGARAWDSRVSTSPFSKIAHVAAGGLSVAIGRSPSPAEVPRSGLYARQI